MQVIAALAFFIFEAVGAWWAGSPEPKGKFGKKFYKYVTKFMVVAIIAVVLYLLYAWITL